jgi:hypothetical protein
MVFMSALVESTKSTALHTQGAIAIRFEVYRDGARLTSFNLVSAMAMGPESVPISGEVVFRDGVIVMPRDDHHAAGVSLLWDIGPLGSFQLETTRLLPREKPYILNVELARFRLMKIVQKLEDWNLFDFPRVDKYTQRFREAQAFFADALGRLDEAEVASKLADQSLAMAVDLSEQLAVFHADLLINRRRTANTFVKHIFGARVDTTIQNQAYRDKLVGNFDYAVLPMGWQELQPQEQEFRTDVLDHWVETLALRRVPIIAGPLIDLNHAPDWLFVFEHDFDMLRELAYEFVQKVIHRYRKAVAIWNVAAGLPTNSGFTLSFEQIIEMTRLLVSQVKNMIPNARVIVTVSHPFGEYHARRKTSVPPMLYAEMIAQAGINFEAFGIEVEMGVPEPGNFARDLFQLSCMLDRFSTLGRPVFITAATAPGRSGPDAADRSGGKLDPNLAGRWHRPWDPQLQADWMEQFYRVCLSKPFVESISWGNLADMNPSLPSGGMMDDLLKPKPVFERLAQMREKFHAWHGKKP